MSGIIPENPGGLAGLCLYSHASKTSMSIYTGTPDSSASNEATIYTKAIIHSTYLPTILVLPGLSR